jgi:tetratricopeptide (TPR) repeat protein
VQAFTPSLDLPAASDALRTVVVRPFDADAALADLGADLARAVADALSGVSRVTVVPPGLPDPGGHVAVDGGVRASGDRARVRVRILDRIRSSQLWAGSIEGSLSDRFALEDGVVAEVLEAVRTHVARAAGGGPKDPELRKIYERARAEYDRFGLPHVQESIRLCEEILLSEPGEPHAMGQLAAGLIRAWAQLGATDPAMAARGEELALRAIAVDPSLPEPYHVVAALRFFAGELRAGLRAEEETLRKNPLHAGAHSQIGRLLAASGRFEEGLRRLELSSRLDPLDVSTTMERARTLALLGHRDSAMRILAEVRERAGPLSTLVLETRLAVWFDDRELAASSAERIRAGRTGAAWERALPLMDSVVSHTPAPEAAHVFAATTSPLVAARHRAMMFAIAAEYWGLMQDSPRALDALEEAARLPTVDLLWMDKCDALASLRDDPRFAGARALVAARVAELWA